MGIFTNPFFSVAGQVERIKNVGATLNAAFNPFSSNKVVANVSNPVVKTVLETAANHPYASALGGAVAAAPKLALAAAVEVAPKVLTAAKDFAKSNPKTTVALALAAPIVVQSSTLKNAIANAPEEWGTFSTNAATAIDNPSRESISKLVTQSPVISTVLGAGALATLGGGIGLAANTVSTILNTKATNANTAPTTDQLITVKDSSGQTLYSTGVLPTASGASSPVPLPQTQTVSSGTTSPKRKKRSSKAVMPSVSQKVNVIVQNKSTSTGIRQSKRYINREIYA